MVDDVNNPGSASGETAIIYEGLRGLAPFGELSAAELADIAERMRRHRFARGDVIIRQGDLGETFYLVRSGTVDVTRRALWRARTHRGRAAQRQCRGRRGGRSLCAGQD